MFVRIAILVAAAILAWAVVAHRSDASSPERVYVVRPADTVWSIASARYRGDPREGVWKIERRNGLGGATIRPGQRLRLP
jgi:hypothetical protein